MGKLAAVCNSDAPMDHEIFVVLPMIAIVIISIIIISSIMSV